MSLLSSLRSSRQSPGAAQDLPPAVDDSRTYVVAGMTCSHCVGAVTSTVSSVPGVTSVDVDLASGHVDVHGPSADDAAIRAAIVDAGYDVISD